MKNIWIYHSVEGNIYYSNPKKAYEAALKFQNSLPRYSTYLKRLRSDGVCQASEETSISKQKVQ